MNIQEVLDIPLEPGQSIMARLRPYKHEDAGDSQHKWTRGNQTEVAMARAAFARAKQDGYVAYKMTENGKKGEVMAIFDPDAERIILAPPMQGGTNATWL